MVLVVGFKKTNRKRKGRRRKRSIHVDEMFLEVVVLSVADASAKGASGDGVLGGVECADEALKRLRLHCTVRQQIGNKEINNALFHQ